MRRWTLSDQRPSGCRMVPPGRAPATSLLFSSSYLWPGYPEAGGADGWWSSLATWPAGPCCMRGGPTCGRATPSARQGAAGSPGQTGDLHYTGQWGTPSTSHTWNVSSVSPHSYIESMYTATSWEPASQHSPVDTEDSHQNIWEMPNGLKSAPPWDWSCWKFPCNPSFIILRIILISQQFLWRVRYWLLIVYSTSASAQMTDTGSPDRRRVTTTRSDKN